MTTIDVTDVPARLSARDVLAPFGRTLLTLLAVVLFALGFAAAKTVAALRLPVMWAATAVALGWRQARPKRTSA